MDAETTVAPTEEVLTMPFVEYDLANGMHVILCKVPEVSLVAVNLWYHVGSKDEDPNRTGFAHLFEHMMFQGSKHVGKAEHFKYVQNVGGLLNATTSVDRTNYFETVSSNDLALALWLESDRMMSLEVTKDNFENQRAVVKEERRQRYDNQPYGTVWENIVERLFPTSGYHWTTIGSMEHLDQATIEDVRNFHRQFYQPNNCSLCLVGGFDEAEARMLIDRYFGDIPGTKAIERPTQKIAPLTKQIRYEAEDAVSLSAFYVAFQGPKTFTADAYACEIMCAILETGRRSRLYQRLVYRDKSARDVHMFVDDNEAGGSMAISAKVQPGHTIEEVENAMWEEIERIKAEGITEHELTKAKNRIEMTLVASRIELAKRADQLQRAYTYRRDPDLANHQIEYYRKVTAIDVRRVAEQYLLRDKCVVAHIRPKQTSV